MSLVLAFSGGKDSTAMAMRLRELGESFQLLFTPTGNELPELRAHVERIVAMTGATLIEPANKPLDYWIQEYGALPNWRQRWCTRLIKIVPCIEYLKTHPGAILGVGLRADEQERQGLYGEFATYRYPLREWGWGIGDVRRYLNACGIAVPRRTDCALCYGQRLAEWFLLWRDFPEEFAKGERWEASTGHTFRSPHRDTWPAALKELRALFEAGRVPRGLHDARSQTCRVCA